MQKAVRVAATAAKQLGPYDNRNFPSPVRIRELISIVREVLGGHIKPEPTAGNWQLLVQRVRQYLALENKTQKTSSARDSRTCSVTLYDAHATLLPSKFIRGACCTTSRGSIAQEAGTSRTKLTSLCFGPIVENACYGEVSVRADREKQLTTDFNDYVNAESYGETV